MGKIHQKMNEAMRDIVPVRKNHKNDRQNYMFRGIDDIYRHVNWVLCKHGIISLPEIISTEQTSYKNSNGTLMFKAYATVKYTFYCEDGSSVSASVLTSAMDFGDKEAFKAMSGAHKYALLQVFCIPTEESKDPEADNGALNIDGIEPVHDADNSKTTNNFEFLKCMAEQKKRLGDTRYYNLLKGYGYEKSNMITDRDMQGKIYKALLSIV